MSDDTYRPIEHEGLEPALEAVLDAASEMSEDRGDVVSILTRDTQPTVRRALLHWDNDRVDEDEEDSHGWRGILLPHSVKQAGHTKAMRRAYEKKGRYIKPALAAQEAGKTGRLVTEAQQHGLAWTREPVPTVDADGEPAEPRVFLFAVYDDA